MNPVPIKEIKDKAETPDKMVIKCVEGVLKELYQENSGDGQYGPWTLQNGLIEDANGDAIKVVFSNCTQPNGARGKKVKIMSTPTDKHGLQGIKVEDRAAGEKNGKQYPAERTIKVTTTAEVVYEGGSPKQSAQSGEKTGGTLQQSYPSQKPSEIIKDVLACHDSVFTLVNDHYKDQTPEFRQSFIASVFIESNKQGACQHFIKRESAPIEKQEEKKEVDQNNLSPADWPEAIVPAGSQKGKKLKDVGDDMLLALFSHFDFKKDNSPFAECVYLAAQDRKVLPQTQEPDNLP